MSAATLKVVIQSRRRRLRFGEAVSISGELVGNYPTGDDAATAAWRKYCDDTASQHEAASKTHGGRERRGPSAGR